MARSIALIIYSCFLILCASAQEIKTKKQATPDTSILMISWKERSSHSGNPEWETLTKLFFVDRLAKDEMDSALIKVLSFDLTVYNSKDEKDSIVFHILNTSFSKTYPMVVKKLQSGTYAYITNIHCRAEWMTPREFVYKRKENEIMVFRNL